MTARLAIVLLALTAASALADEDDARRNPHGPKPPRRDPALDGPFGPVYRYVEGKPIILGHTREPRDPALGFMAPVIRPASGGFLFSAHRDDRTQADKEKKDAAGYAVYVAKSVPLVVKLRDDGSLEWQRAFDKRGFVDYEGGLVGEAKDGDFLAVIPSWVHHGALPVQRLFKLDRATGDVRWQVQLRGDGGRNTPFARTAHVMTDGTIVLEGHIYLVERSEEGRLWRGEISASGRLLADRSGPIMPAVGDGPLVFDALEESARGWLQNRVATGRDPDRPAYLYAFKQHIGLAHPRFHVAPASKRAIPVIQTAGGFLIVGVRDAPRRPVVVKLDAQGQPEWERSLEQAGFDAYGGGLALETGDGDALVFIPAHHLATWGYTATIYRLAPNGDIRWSRELPVIAASGRAPEPEQLQLGPDGRLELEGLAYPTKDLVDIQYWRGTIDPKGNLVANELVGPRPTPGR